MSTPASSSQCRAPGPPWQQMACPRGSSCIVSSGSRPRASAGPCRISPCSRIQSASHTPRMCWRRGPRSSPRSRAAPPAGHTSGRRGSSHSGDSRSAQSSWCWTSATGSAAAGGAPEAGARGAQGGPDGPSVTKSAWLAGKVFTKRCYLGKKMSKNILGKGNIKCKKL